MRLRAGQTRNSPQPRSGAVLVENALVISVFGVFLAGIMEFGHCYLMINTLNAAAKRSARYGACDEVTTAQVRAKATEILSASMKADKATILIKDAGIFDTSGVDASSVNYAALPNIELSTAPSRKLYVVRITVPYKDVALIPPFWAQNAVLHGQSVMRHE